MHSKKTYHIQLSVPELLTGVNVGLILVGLILLTAVFVVQGILLYCYAYYQGFKHGQRQSPYGLAWEKAPYHSQDGVVDQDGNHRATQKSGYEGDDEKQSSTVSMNSSLSNAYYEELSMPIIVIPNSQPCTPRDLSDEENRDTSTDENRRQTSWYLEDSEFEIGGNKQQIARIKSSSWIASKKDLY
ncbi:hypothetical protein F5Y19DRAFT_471898 [Xylariaceae sp. FL1651]|nr:hypothetical protein F5Y19DRAFT_471898 [Xylariaceae sp. FL1651]